MGAGQAGLATGYYLKKLNKNFIIIDAGNKIGDTWRNRWDSLELFTPRPFAALPGAKVSREYSYYPTKDEIADYLETYAIKYQLPIIQQTKVISIKHQGSSFIINTSLGSVTTKKVVIAAGPYTKAFIPTCAIKLNKTIHQMHSSEYKNPQQFASRSVTIIGGGNSATQIAEELFNAGKIVTLISSKMPWFLPKTIFGISSYWWFYLTGILNSPATSRISIYVRQRGDGIIGTKALKLIKSNLINHISSKVVGATSNKLELQDKRQIKPESVLWATGFKPDYSWLKIPKAVGDDGIPNQNKGVSIINGIYWVGLPWQSRMNSGIINGVGQDAKNIVSSMYKQD